MPLHTFQQCGLALSQRGQAVHQVFIQGTQCPLMVVLLLLQRVQQLITLRLQVAGKAAALGPQQDQRNDEQQRQQSQCAVKNQIFHFFSCKKAEGRRTPCLPPGSIEIFPSQGMLQDTFKHPKQK